VGASFSRRLHHPSARFLRYLLRFFFFLPAPRFSSPAAFAKNLLDGLPELGGGDGLYREILRDETVLRLKELGKVRPSIDPFLPISWNIHLLAIRFSSSGCGILLGCFGPFVITCQVARPDEMQFSKALFSVCIFPHT
jgi:hypothetical protein